VSSEGEGEQGPNARGFLIMARHTSSP
jgi:hypothetical protein